MTVRTSWGDGTSGPDALLHRAKLPETVLTKADHVLVTTGPYRWMRHPLYAMGGALFVAVGLMSASWFILGVSRSTLKRWRRARRRHELR